MLSILAIFISSFFSLHTRVSAVDPLDLTQQSSEITYVYEVEPNGYFELADNMGLMQSDISVWAFGQIGDPYNDVDIWKFTLPSSGSVSIYAYWAGNHYTKGYEDDLAIGLFEYSYGEYNLITVGKLETSGMFTFRVIRESLTQGTYYLMLYPFNNQWISLYRNEDYHIQLDYYPAKALSDIRMSKLPKVHYLPGENIDPTGGVVYASYTDGSRQSHSLTSNMLSGYNPYSNVYGPQTVTVTFEGLKTSFEVYLNRFTDVPYGHSVYTRINDLADKGIINGYQDNTFRPNNNITRAQAAVMIVRALGIDQKGKTSNFADVPTSHASYEFISAAYEAGIISGYSADNTFRPNDNITRQQIAVMIQRAFNIEHSGSEVSFADVKDSMPSKRFIEALASNRIINGYSDGTFRPTNNTTRAQFSSMIYNAMRYGK